LTAASLAPCRPSCRQKTKKNRRPTEGHEIEPAQKEADRKQKQGRKQNFIFFAAFASQVS